MSPDPNLVERLERYGQGHLLAWWSDLTDAQRVRLQAEIAAIDFDQLERPDRRSGSRGIRGGGRARAASSRSR